MFLHVPFSPIELLKLRHLYSGGNALAATVSKYGGLRSKVFSAVVALSRSLLSIASILAFVKYIPNSSDWYVGRLAADRFLAFVG